MGGVFSSQGAGIGVGIGLVIGIAAVIALFGTMIYKVEYLYSLLSAIQAYGVPLLFAIVSFLPFGLLMFGFISDMITGALVNTGGLHNSFISLVALLAMVVSGLGGQMLARYQGIDLSPINTSGDYGWCTIPGMAALESPYLPMQFLSSSMIMTYIITCAALAGAGNIELYAGFGATYFLQMVTFYAASCTTSYVPLGSILGNIGLTTAIGCLIGGMLGAFGPDQYKTFNRTGPLLAGRDTHVNKAVSPYASGAPDSATCSPQQDGDENVMVAELYKNGQPVTAKIA